MVAMPAVLIRSWLLLSRLFAMLPGGERTMLPDGEGTAG